MVGNDYTDNYIRSGYAEQESERRSNKDDFNKLVFR